MNVPVRLYRRTRDGTIVETLEPGETGALLYGQGAALVESEAEASGVAAYLRDRAALASAKANLAAKAVRLQEVEDKALRVEEVEDKGLAIPPDPRRSAGRPRPAEGER